MPLSPLSRVVQDVKVSPIYDAVFWSPPKSEQYQFKNKRPPVPHSPKVYEAHGQSLRPYVRRTRD